MRGCTVNQVRGFSLWWGKGHGITPFRSVPIPIPSSFLTARAIAHEHGRGGRCDPTPLAYPSRLAEAGLRRDEPAPNAGGEGDANRSGHGPVSRSGARWQFGSG